MTDWGSAYGSSGGGSSGGGWASVYGGSSGGGIAVGGGGSKKKSSGGGGLLGLVENLGSDVGNTVIGIPRGLISLGEKTAHTLGPSGVTESLSQFWHDPQGLGGGLARPFIQQERQTYGPVLHGNFHQLYQHPLTPILDVATLLSGGGALAAKAGEAGVLGSRAAELARATRTLRAGNYEEPLNVARTLQGRYLQRKFDAFSSSDKALREGGTPIRDLPVVGANARLARIGEVRKYRQTIRAAMPARDFQRVTAPLTKDEKFAYHVAAEGVPLHERIDFYRKELRDNPTAQLRDYVHQLERPGVAKALAEPRRQFVDALKAGSDLQDQATQRLIDAGQLTRETHDVRSVLPQRIMGGGEYAYPASEHIPGHDPFALDRREMTRASRRAQTDLNRAQRRLDVVNERLRIHGNRRARLGEDALPVDKAMLTRARKAVADARTQLEESKQRKALATEGVDRLPPPVPAQTIKTEGEFVGGPKPEDLVGQPNRVHEAFPPAFRFPHTGDEAANPGLFTQPSNAAALRPAKTPGFLRHSEAVRLRTARLITNPEVLTKDYLATMRFEHLNELYRKVIRPASSKLDAGLERTGFKKPDEFYVWEKPSQRAPRSVTQQEAMSRDLNMIDANARETEAGAAARERVFASPIDAPTEIRQAFESRDFAKLEQMGVRRVPGAFAKRYNANFASTGKMVRLFWDRPLDVWRAITLNLRPAWMVNNLVGNAAQYALRYAGVQGAVSFLRALLQTERGTDKYLQIRNWTMRVPTLQRKWGRVFDEVAPEVHGTGLYSTHVKVTKGGVYQSTIDQATATRAARALSVPAKVLVAGLKAVPRGITAFERHFAESVPREAAMMNELHPVIQKLGLAHLPLEDAIKAVAKHDTEAATRYVELATDRMLDYMGDFNALNATERRVLKRIIPFESWYRVITQVSAKLAIHYPARILLLRQLGLAYQQDNETLPSWLKGAIPVGPTKKGVQPVLSTTGLNPYETLVQLATQNPTGVANPFLQGVVTGAVNVDPFTMGTYHGPGAGTGQGPGAFAKRYAGSIYEGLVPTRLYEQTTGKSKSTLYQPKTYGHAGPVAVNDYLLQYLGLPIRHVKRGVAKRYSQEGR